MLITGLLDIYALIFGIIGGIFAEILYGAPLGGFFATLFNNASVTDLWGVGPEDARCSARSSRSSAATRG